MWSCSNVRGGLAPARPPLSPPLTLKFRYVPADGRMDHMLREEKDMLANS